MIVLDTTILVYAVGGEHPLRAPCRHMLAAHGEGRIEATTTIEVIQEFAHIRARRRTRSDAVRLARHYLSAFTVLVALVSADRAFASIPNLRWVDPATPALQRFISA